MGRKKALIFYGQPRCLKVSHHYYSKYWNLSEWDIYMCTWKEDREEAEKFKDFYNIKNIYYVDPIEYCETLSYYKTSSQELKRAVELYRFAQYISIANCINVASLQDYDDVFVTRTDIIVDFDYPKKLEDGYIYDWPFTQSFKNKHTKALFGYFLLGNGKTMDDFCRNFFKNIFTFHKIYEKWEEYFKSIKLDFGYILSSPRALWWVGSLHKKDLIKIKTLTKLKTIIIRPGIENYNYKNEKFVEMYTIILKRNLLMEDLLKSKQIQYQPLLDVIDIESASLEGVKRELDYLLKFR